MKEIPLTGGNFAIVDDEDHERVSKNKWQLNSRHGVKDPIFYARAKINTKIVQMHRVILNAKNGQYIDHINGNGLDNRKCNLRFATRSQNLMNQKPQKYK